MPYSIFAIISWLTDWLTSLPAKLISYSWFKSSSGHSIIWHLFIYAIVLCLACKVRWHVAMSPSGGRGGRVGTVLPTRAKICWQQQSLDRKVLVIPTLPSNPIQLLEKDKGKSNGADWLASPRSSNY